MANVDSFRFVDPYALPSVPTPRSSGTNSPRLTASPGRGPHQRIAQMMYDRVTNDPSHQAAKHHADLRQQSPRSMGRSGGAKPTHRPNFLVCYLCGQQFSKGSLKIHQPQCYVKQLIAWERGGASGSRGGKPMHPDEWNETMQRSHDNDLVLPNTSGGADAFNAQQMQHFNTVGMSSCEHCGRTFLPDRLVVHQRSCKPGKSAKPVRKAPTPHTPIVAPLPRDAGSPLGTSSPQRPEAQQPPHDALSDTDELESILAGTNTTTDSRHREATPSPEGYVGAGSLSSTKRGDHEAAGPNDAAQRRHQFSVSPNATVPPLSGAVMTQAHGASTNRAPEGTHVPVAASVTPNGLVRCKFCGRTFAPDRLERHEGVCIERGGPGAAASSSGPGRALSGSNSNNSRGSSAAIKAPSRHSSLQLNASFGSKASEGNLTGRRPRASPPPQVRQSENHPLSDAHASRSGSSRNGSPGAVCDGASSSGHNTPPPGHHLPKFCTECGERLAYNTQKFCGECGMRVVR